jgi:hypothetical protein
MRMTFLDGRAPEWTGILVGLTIVRFGLILLFDQTGFRMATVLECLAVPDHRSWPRAVRDTAAGWVA